MTRNEIITARAAAGAVYALAAAEYIRAAIELEGFDKACSNGRIVAPIVGGGFGEQPRVLAHTEFLAHVTDINADPAGRAMKRAEEILKTLID